MVVLVNIGCATLRITDKEYVHTNEDVEVYQLEHGAVIRFDSKLLHRLDPVKQERWSLSFRHLKSEYLP
jgi:hypothetical protein